MRRSRLLAVLLLLALAAGGVFLWFGDGSAALPDARGDAATPAGDAGARGAPVEPAAPVAREREAASAATPSGDRSEVAPDTVLTGTFRAPTGGWPGGGTAVLVPPAMPMEGGMMGVFSAGMELAGEGDDEQSERGEEIEARMKAWLGRAEPVATTRVDPRGRFTFREPPAGPWDLMLRHDTLHLAEPARVAVEAGQKNDAGQILVAVAGSLLIVVSDPDGAPIADAEIAVAREIDPARFTDPSALADIGSLMRSAMPHEAHSDANGRCVLQGLTADAKWNLSVEKAGFVTDHRPLRVVDGQQTIHRITLSRGAGVRATVVGPDGTPFPGASLRLQYLDLTRPNAGSIHFSTSGGGGGSAVVAIGFDLDAGPDGVAERHGLPAGRAELRLTTPGYRPATVAVVVPTDGVIEKQFVLDRGATIEGVVLDEQGAPIEGAHVLSMAILGQSVMGIELDDMIGLDVLTMSADERGVATDAEGRFVFGGFEAGGGEVPLAAVAKGFDPQRADATVGDRDVTFRLLRACAVRGRVIDAVTEEPVPAFRIALQQRAFLVVDRAVVQRRFEGREDGTFEVEPVPRQSFELVVEADGYATSTTSVDLSAGTVDCGTVRMELPAAIEGVVVGPDGTPVVGAKVRASKGGPADSMLMATLLGADLVESGPDGVFRLEGLTGRAVRVCVDADGFAPLRSRAVRIAAGETVRDVVLELTRGGSIRGEVVDANGQPLEGWRVQAEHATGSSHAWTKSDPAGAFLLEGLEGGSYKVTGMPPDFMERNAQRQVQPSDLGELDIGALIAEAMSNTVEARVVVRDGEESEVSLVFEGGENAAAGGLVALEGEVTVGGSPLPGGIIALYPAGSALPRHIADVTEGHFAVSRVRPGTYRVQTRAGLLGGDVGTSQVVVVPEAAQHRVRVDLPGGVIAGRVVDADDGRPVAGVIVTLSRPDAASVPGERMDVGEGAAMTDGDGTFRFRGLDAGVYEVFAKQWALGGGGGRSGRRSAISIAGSEVREDVEVRLERGSILRVTVDDGTRPRANALVTLLGPHGEPIDLFHRALTDRDGIAEFAGLPRGVYRASVDAPPAAPAVSAPVELRGDAGSVEVTVRAGVPVILKLIGDVPESWVGEPLTYAVWREDGSLLRSGRAIVPPAGAAENAARAGMPVGAYASGRYRVRIESPRLGVVDETRQVPASGAAEWVIDVGAVRRR